MVERAQAGQHGRAPEGRRPVRVRARRRGGAARCAPPASPSRSSRASPRASPRRPTRASPSPTAGSRRAVALVTGHEDRRATASSTGRRSRPSRARSSSTWACAACRRSPPSLIAAGRARRRSPRRSSKAGTLPGQRTVTATLATIAERVARERRPAAVDHGRRSRSPRWPSSSPGCAPRPLAGRTVAVTRARAQASGLARRLRELGARGRAGAGRSASQPLPGPRARPVAVRPDLPDEPERRRGAVRAPRRRRARRARAGRRAGRGDRPGHRRGAARARDRGRRRPRALRRRGARRGARRRAGDAAR